MRDLDRFSKRSDVRRMADLPETNVKVYWFGTVSRLFAILVLILFLGWGMWSLSKPANIWTSHSEIHQTETDVRTIHEDAEKARLEMAAPREITVESLVYRCLNEAYELTEDERTFLKKNWEKFLQNSNIQGDENLLFRLRMRYNDQREIEDFPQDEWEKAKEARQRKKPAIDESEKMRQAVESEVKEFAKDAGKRETQAIIEENKAKRAKYEERSNREMIRELVKEINENFYTGKNVEETVEEETEPEIHETKTKPETSSESSEKTVSEEPASEEPASEESVSEESVSEEPVSSNTASETVEKTNNQPAEEEEKTENE